MPLQRLEHYLVLSDDIHKTRDFYRDVLGMTEGFRPELEFSGYWLYLGDVPCIHIAEWQSYAKWTKKAGIPVSTRAPSTGSVDHIAFNGTGFDEVRDRLVARGLPFNENTIEDARQDGGRAANAGAICGQRLRQMFFRDPNGVPLEINFRD